MAQRGLIPTKGDIMLKTILIVCLSFLAFNTYGTVSSSIFGVDLKVARIQKLEQDCAVRQCVETRPQTAPSPLQPPCTRCTEDLP